MTLTDAAGARVYRADTEVSAAVNGPGELVGVFSADPRGAEPITAPRAALIGAGRWRSSGPAGPGRSP
ncbi:hypothetical protein [Actinomyces sp. CtC 72]|uniref:hypothetical protein n=1 Tax=Actinomyces ruminis TaxID=1937003 RepID=UPI0015D500D0